eukprot:m.28352 g.28352  ORF g.28352 m.28352 type:complete len:84 (+) comp6039_c0_seq1:237-488(+)
MPFENNNMCNEKAPQTGAPRDSWGLSDEDAIQLDGVEDDTVSDRSGESCTNPETLLFQIYIFMYVYVCVFMYIILFNDYTDDN